MVLHQAVYWWKNICKQIRRHHGYIAVTANTCLGSSHTPLLPDVFASAYSLGCLLTCDIAALVWTPYLGPIDTISAILTMAVVDVVGG